MTRRGPIPLISTLLLGLVATGCGQAIASTFPAEDAAAHVIPRYEREAFGDGWADLDRDCQDTRNEILIRDLVDERLDRDGCKVLTGTLHDSYTGATISFVRGLGTSDDVQIDHIVPLAYAWQAGAHRWTDDRREVFANDPANLRAVHGPTNNAKGADGPASWLPPNIAAHCSYAEHWTEVLRTYELTPRPADAAVLAEITKECK